MGRFYGFWGYAAQILFDYLRLFAACSYKYDYTKQKGKNRRKKQKEYAKVRKQRKVSECTYERNREKEQAGAVRRDKAHDTKARRTYRNNCPDASLLFHMAQML